MSQPMIDSARLQFSGLSSEDFEDVPEIGEERTYTIRARCQSHTEREMANEGTRKSVNMKVTRVLSGVSSKIDEEPDQEPSLFDTAAADAEKADDNEEADESAGEPTAAFEGPSFSAGDE